MMVNLIDAIGTFDTRVAELLIVIGIAAIGDGVRLVRTGARPEASDGHR
jgi:hypothetical protein